MGAHLRSARVEKNFKVIGEFLGKLVGVEQCTLELTKLDGARILVKVNEVVNFNQWKSLMELNYTR